MHAAAQNTFPATGSVGIGIIAPQDKLDVNGSALFGPLLEKINIGSGSLRLTAGLLMVLFMIADFMPTSSNKRDRHLPVPII